MRGFHAMYAHSQRLPSRVIWVADQPGNGLCVPKDKRLAAWMMKNFQMDGVAYSYGEPDFEPFVPTIYPRDLMSAEFARFRRTLGKDTPVVCGAGDGIRCQFVLEDTISADRSVNKRYCCSQIAGFMGGNVSADVIADYFRFRQLTCHEPSDLHTLQVIPRRINAAFGHTAGISTIRHVEQFLDISHEAPAGGGS